MIYPEVLFCFNAPKRIFSACQIICEHYQKMPDRRTLVFCPSKSLANDLDNLLWRFQKMSFVPHSVYGSPVSDYTNVLIIHHRIDVFEGGTLVISIMDQLLENWERATKIVEIVSIDNNKEKSLARQRFCTYRKLCKNFNSIDLSKTDMT
ncbi:MULTISPECIES: DNA polymerase III subunit chi [Candidatus Ichthyocystis]|uniref:DNA polymerase III subunit chi n=2 Tax=Burkholderiales genera incertae sedis TaxID=224471 RepID=UPI001F5E40C3|nr:MULTISPECIES: DNA polymerase III subunit chi [Ichthyocystis]